jgi:membrane associated rhomboid family serine protease
MSNTQWWRALRLPLFFVIILWLIEGMSILTGERWTWLGIIPRTMSGIPGIFFSAFIHGNAEHLLSNTLPLLVAGTGIIYFYNDIAKNVIAMIWLFSGFWVWLAARDSTHIGASGIIYGLVCFLFFGGILRKDTRLLAISLLVTFLYGSMVWGILPIDQKISWESHLAGSIAGIISAFYYKSSGPPRKKYQYEIDEELEAIQAQSTFHDDDYWNEPRSINVKYDFVPKKSDENNINGEENKS